MAGRVTGEMLSRDFGLAIAIQRRSHERFSWKLLFVVGPATISIGLWRSAWSRRRRGAV